MIEFSFGTPILPGIVNFGITTEKFPCSKFQVQELFIDSKYNSGLSMFHFFFLSFHRLRYAVSQNNRGDVARHW